MEQSNVIVVETKGLHPPFEVGMNNEILGGVNSFKFLGSFFSKGEGLQDGE